MEEAKQKLERLILDSNTYFNLIKSSIKVDLRETSNRDIMQQRGMCKFLLKSYITVNDLIRIYPELANDKVDTFLFQFNEYYKNVESIFYNRIKDIDSPNLDEILDEYKDTVKFLENWLLNVYNPTIDLFTKVNLDEISLHSINITFDQVNRNLHLSDILVGICSDLHIYKTRLEKSIGQLNYLYKVVNEVRLKKLK